MTYDITLPVQFLLQQLFGDIIHITYNSPTQTVRFNGFQHIQSCATITTISL